MASSSSSYCTKAAAALFLPRHSCKCFSRRLITAGIIIPIGDCGGGRRVRGGTSLHDSVILSRFPPPPRGCVPPGSFLSSRSRSPTPSPPPSWCWRPFSTTRDEQQQQHRRRSPYTILQLRTSATKDEIKSSFRRLAKKFHPDLNPELRRRETTTAEEESGDDKDGGYNAMAELIGAYDQLMDDDFGGRVGDSRVSLACEVYSVEELRMDRLHDVYSLQIVFDDDDDDDDSEDSHDFIDVVIRSGDEGGGGGGGSNNDDAAESPSSPSVVDIVAKKAAKQNEDFGDDGMSSMEISNDVHIPIRAHPEDSISDFKRYIQSRFTKDWGLDGRRLDRDGLATGWEIVFRQRVLSYHLFLRDYGIKNDDVLHAVVRRYDDVERDASSSSSSSSSGVR